jgi:hypothetical protein
MKSVLRKLIPIIDLVLSVLIAPSALVMKTFRRVGAGRLPISSRMLFTIGVFPIADHYYEPSFNPSNYRNRLRETRELPGLMIDLDSQL